MSRGEAKNADHDKARAVKVEKSWEREREQSCKNENEKDKIILKKKKTVFSSHQKLLACCVHLLSTIHAQPHIHLDTVKMCVRFD